jgi:hypothetical protein
MTTLEPGSRVRIGHIVTGWRPTAPGEPRTTVTLAPGTLATVRRVDHYRYDDVATVETDAGTTAEVVTLWLMETEA